MSQHALQARDFVRNEARTRWHDEALWHLRERRDTGVHGVPEWELLRETASQIKDHTLEHLGYYLRQFAERAEANGVIVHWARDAADHNKIIHGILADAGTTLMVKSKSMLTEECGLNDYLIGKGFNVIDTDLGERIVQLADEPPSHIVAPAIHKKKEEIGELFVKTMGSEPGNAEPDYLVQVARKHLRYFFAQPHAALTGVNFAIAETGGVVVCTNEGNSDMGTHLADIQIHSMGIEKIIPLTEHLGVFTRLLARSGTGQPITIYTSHYHRPLPGKSMHIVIVDNLRSSLVQKKQYRQTLKCIRCGACMNTCPVYRRSGGYSYHATIPGPIGSVLNPHRDATAYTDLPFASSLCGSCSAVCPVKIDLHGLLYRWRQDITPAQNMGLKKTVMNIMGFVFTHPRTYRWSFKLLRTIWPLMPRLILYNKLNAWGQQREMPHPAPQSFRSWFLKNRPS